MLQKEYQHRYEALNEILSSLQHMNFKCRLLEARIISALLPYY